MTSQIGKPWWASAAAAVVLGAAFVICWSSGFIGAKLGASDAPVPTVLMWRFVPLAIVLTPFLCRSKYRGSADGGMWRHVVIGALSQSGYLLTVYWAIGLGVSTGTTALIDGVQPLVVAALAGPLLGTFATGRQWFGLILGVAGVLLVTWADAASPATEAPIWAYAVPVLGMGCLVAATFLERQAPAPLHPMRALAIHCTTSAVIFTAIALATGTAAPPLVGTFWIAMAWLVILATFGGYGLYWHLLRRVGVTRVNTLMFLVPPVTTMWGALMFGEPLTVVTVIGLLLALTATWIVTTRANTRPQKIETTGPDTDTSRPETRQDR